MEKDRTSSKHPLARINKIKRERSNDGHSDLRFTVTRNRTEPSFYDAGLHLCTFAVGLQIQVKCSYPCMRQESAGH